jgi:hypothetical protein
LPTAAGQVTLHVMLQGNAADAGWVLGCGRDKEPVLPANDLCAGLLYRVAAALIGSGGSR